MEERETLGALEHRLKIILPAEYGDCYEEVQPLSMGSAGLKFDRDGKVAWDEIWSGFCDLAMAGGPPHKGQLLEAGSAESIATQPEAYRRVVEEICRGVALVSELTAEASPIPGWVRVDCASPLAAEWLVRAITMENVAVRLHGDSLDLPAGPDFRLEKEIKNVVTVIAKTFHYWFYHVSRGQERNIAEVFASMPFPLLQPGDGPQQTLADQIFAETGIQFSPQRYPGWLGLICPDVRGAIWMMRALVAGNILSRREETVLFVPVNPAEDPGGGKVLAVVSRTHRFAKERGIL